jgi:hypothetical protein
LAKVRGKLHGLRLASGFELEAVEYAVGVSFEFAYFTGVAVQRLELPIRALVRFWLIKPVGFGFGGGLDLGMGGSSRTSSGILLSIRHEKVRKEVTIYDLTKLRSPAEGGLKEKLIFPQLHGILVSNGLHLVELQWYKRFKSGWL